MTSSVGAAVQDLEARSRANSLPRSRASSTKRTSTDSVERQLDTSEAAMSPDGDAEPDRKRAASDRLSRVHDRPPIVSRGSQLDQAAAPETPAGTTTSLVSSAPWSRVSLPKSTEMTYEDAMQFAAGGAPTLSTQLGSYLDARTPFKFSEVSKVESKTFESRPAPRVVFLMSKMIRWVLRRWPLRDSQDPGTSRSGTL